MERKAVPVVMLAVLLLSMVVALGAVGPSANASSDEWWDTSWSHRRAVTIENPNPFNVIEYPVSISLDTQSLISAGKMKPDGSDLRLIFGNVEVDFAVVDLNTATTKIVLKSSIPANGIDSNYALYYGNPLASDASVSYEKIKYELIDEFNDGVIDPMWSFSEHAVNYYESDGFLYIEKGPTGGLVPAYTTGINISNSEVLRIQFRAETGEVGWAGYNGVWIYLYGPETSYIGFSACTYEKSPNRAGPYLTFDQLGRVSTEIAASRIDWTQLNYKWYDYEVYWNESSNFARVTTNDSYYDNEDTNGYFEDYSFDTLWLCVGAYYPSGTAYAKFDYIRFWQEVSKEPTTSVGAEEAQLLTLTITMTNVRSGSTETNTLEFIDEDHDGFIIYDIENRIWAAIRRTHKTTTFDFPGEYTATKGAWMVTLSSSNDYTVTFT